MLEQMPSITTEEYRALAELRHRIRLFLREGDAKSRKSGLEPQQYLLLLALRGLPDGAEGTIRTLADRLALKHHSVVELVDRMSMRGYVRRNRSRNDRRRVLVSILPRGEKLLEDVARQRISELRSSGAALVRAIEALLEKKPGKYKEAKRSPRRRGARVGR
jgi:DNA-binding MarR family transcriptional regulator